MVAADFSIRSAFIINDVPSDGEYPIRDRHGRLLSASTRRHPPEERRQEAVFLVGDGPGALRQDASQITVAFPHGSGKSLASALVVARTYPGPTHQMSRVRKSAHVRPDLGDDHSSGGEIDSGNRAQSADQIWVRS
jgi:hypothetical protein